MALVDTNFYVDSVGWTAITVWPSLTAVAAGVLRRQVSPTAGNERVFVCIVAGTTLAAEPTWVLTRGAKTAEAAGPTWPECTGVAGVNGDLTNTANWTAVKNTAVTIGQIIQRDNGASYQICSTAGTAGNGSEPAFSNTAGTTTADNTITWTSLGVVGNFTGNQAPAARIQTVFASSLYATAGNNIFVKSSHAETAASNTTLGGSATDQGNPIKIMCHNGSAYPPLSANLTTGASVSTTGGNGLSLSINGAAYFRGITFVCDNGSGGGNLGVGGQNTTWIGFENCSLQMGTTNGAATIIFNVGTGSTAHTDLINTKCKFLSVNQQIRLRDASIKWDNHGAGFLESGSSIPTALFAGGGTSVPLGVNVDLCGIDFSDFSTGKTLVEFAAVAAPMGKMTVRNCKLDASVTRASTPLGPVVTVDFINTNSGAVNYDARRYRYEATLIPETTIVLTGGASDGTTAIAWRVDTTANARPHRPFECFPIAIWNNTTGSKTLTIQGIWGGGAVPNNDEIWVEVEYLGSSSTPISSFVSDGLADVLAAATGQDAGTGTWGGSTTKFALAVTFTVNMKGPIIARVKCAKVSSTFYIDPKITLT